MKIHPLVWNDIIKMYEYSHDYPSINIIFKRLDIETDEITSNNFKKILIGLDFEEGIAVIEDILKDPNFWLTEEDERNKRRSQQLNSYRTYKKIFQPQIPGMHSIFNKTEEDFVETIDEPDIPKEHYWGEKILNLLRKHYEVIYENSQLYLNGIHRDRKKIINNDLLIERKFEDYFYKELCHEMNLIYRQGLYTAVVILNRKLFESLIIEFLEKKFPDKDNLYFNHRRKNYVDLRDLIKIFREQGKELSDRKRILNSVISKLEKYRQEGNKGTHNKFFIPKKEDIEVLNINEVLELFLILCEDNKVSIK